LAFNALFLRLVGMVVRFNYQLYFSVWGVCGHMLSDANTTSMTVNEAKKILVSGGVKRSLLIRRTKNSVIPTINSCLGSINYL